jgi:hypothetical protein
MALLERESAQAWHVSYLLICQEMGTEWRWMNHRGCQLVYKVLYVHACQAKKTVGHSHSEAQRIFLGTTHCVVLFHPLPERLILEPS